MEFEELFTQLLIDLQAVFRKNNKNTSLSLSQVIVLSSIPVDGIIMGDLALRIGVDNSTLTRLIGVLKNKGLVKKISNNEDKRSKLINLTDLGENSIKIIETSTSLFTEKTLKSLSHLDKALLKESLNKLHWDLTKYKLTDN
jgi:MarR family transcriptional regulator for hemolysin